MMTLKLYDTMRGGAPHFYPCKDLEEAKRILDAVHGPMAQLIPGEPDQHIAIKHNDYLGVLTPRAETAQ